MNEHQREWLANVAAERGGVCLSTSMKSGSDRLRFRCRLGHEFESVVHWMNSGRWCPRCRQAPRGSLKRLREVVDRKGGTLLSTEYEGSRTPVRVRCREGHEWSVAPTNLLGGSWCRVCWVEGQRNRPRKRLSLADMQEVAASRGGLCLSDTYVNALTHLRWRCHNGHEWETTPALVRSGHWCPRCAHSHCGSIDGMRALAAERGGRCHSNAYQNHTDLLRFTCTHGHKFTATGMLVKSGVWCPTCEEEHR